MFGFDLNKEFKAIPNTLVVSFGALCNLLTIPIFLLQLDSQDFGLWLIFSNLVTLMLLLLLGLDTTLPRLLSYILSGFKEVHHQKISSIDFYKDKVDIKLLNVFFRTTKSLIFKLTCFQIFIISAFLPFIHFISLRFGETGSLRILVEWLVYGIGGIFLFVFNLYNSLLRGTNSIWVSNLLVVFQRLSFLLLSILFLSFEKNLLAIGIASVMSNFFVFILSRRMVHKKFSLMINDSLIGKQYGNFTYGNIFQNTKKVAINSLSGFLILRTSLLSSVIVLLPNDATRFNLTVTLFLALYGISLEVARNYNTSLNIYQAKKDSEQLARTFKQMRFHTLGFFIVSGLFLMIFGGKLVSSISGDLTLIPLGHFIVLFAIYVLEMNHTISAIYLSSHNIFPVTYPGIISGILIALTGYVLANEFSIWGYIMAQGAIQLAYNNWKWPLAVRKELKAGN